MTRGIRLKWSSPRTRDTLTCCRAFGSGAAPTCFATKVCPDRGLNPDLPHTKQTFYLYATLAVIINLKFRKQISLNYEENTVDAEFLVLNGKGLTLLEIDTASALGILKLGINALKPNDVFQSLCPNHLYYTYGSVS